MLDTIELMRLTNQDSITKVRNTLDRMGVKYVYDGNKCINTNVTAFNQAMGLTLPTQEDVYTL